MRAAGRQLSLCTPLLNGVSTHAQSVATALFPVHWKRTLTAATKAWIESLLTAEVPPPLLKYLKACAGAQSQHAVYPPQHHIP